MSVPIDPYKPLIKIKWPDGGYIVWNWHTGNWDFIK